MAYRDDRLDHRFGCGHAIATATASEIRAGYGECMLCPCPKFEGGTNETYCGGCGHHKDDHRY